ncbi:CDP-alcohol phosphatidyltransferase family protein [Microbacterium sp. NPDC058389]|uniref:CDP-alcohol phosphatidyltransferase family protein n=1 Tax=Microbacterium sp. NPDC058389 TaxID=3346475 RepID=UPI00365FB5E6
MRKVQSTPWWWAAAGIVALFVVGALVPLPPLAWAAGIAYLVVSSLLVSLGLRRRGATRFGAANAVTATRSMLVGVATALVVASVGGEASTALLVGIVAVALALDGVDGYVARRTGSVSELGARFDMEVDAFLLLVLSVYDARVVGWWVLAIGLMRYAFVVVAWLVPWFDRTLPYRYWRKVVTAACGVALTVVATQLLPPPANVLVAAAALGLLVESFGRDVVWLIRMNRADTDYVSPQEALTRDSDGARDESR